MERKRTEAGTYAEGIPLEDVRDVFDAVRGPVVTSSDVAEALECTTEAARQKLTRLYDRGEVDKRKTGRTVVYWRADEDVLAAGDLQGDPTTTLDESDESGRESEPTPAPTEPSGEADHRDDTAEDALGAVEFPTGRDREECSTAVYAARDYLREHGPATMREIVADVMPTHPVGYDADDAVETVEAGDRYRGAWWRKVVKPGLKALPDVTAPTGGASKWRVQT